ncbi:hypothetical protein AVEN_254361-1 [Araneus ventricosus]|uniref:Uncharacterized protein n=1 Tax=Araneus ventricosus TaxID=182803 RepID=A0A4Y2KGZ4_ARAVE|nr:hypothetical protein AVEN_254361-1 [Araneus ventricosus]
MATLISGKVFSSGLRSKPDSSEDHLCMWTCCTLPHTQWAKRPPSDVVSNFGEKVPAQGSLSSSGNGSVLRGPSPNSPRAASKRDVNITEKNNKIKTWRVIKNSDLEFDRICIIFSCNISHTRKQKSSAALICNKSAEEGTL